MADSHDDYVLIQCMLLNTSFSGGREVCPSLLLVGFPEVADGSLMETEFKTRWAFDRTFLMFLVLWGVVCVVVINIKCYHQLAV